MITNKNSKIYVAGHTGLVGSNIFKKLKEKGYTNLISSTEVNMDLRRQEEVETFFSKEKPEYVFFAAAKVGGIVANSTYKAEFIYDNLAIALNVINSSYRFGVKKLLNLGSSCIYPKLAPQPLKEDYLLDGTLEPTNEPYAIAKIAAIKLCTSYNFQYGTDFLSVMPTNLFGQNDNFNLETSHVLPALIRKMILAQALRTKNFPFIINDISKRKLGNGIDEKEIINDESAIISALEKIGVTEEYVKIWGSGNVFREFLYVDDMAEACVFVMENFTFKETGDFLNIGTGEDISIKSLSELIKNIVGFEGKFIFDSGKPDGTPRKLLDVSRINSLGWKAKISLEEGIRKVVSQYQSY